MLCQQSRPPLLTKRSLERSASTLRAGNWASSTALGLIKEHSGKALSLALVAVLLFITIPERLDEKYYHMIENRDYAAFVWIRDNLGDEYERTLLDPWQGAAFLAITGKKVYSWISTEPKDIDIKARAFIEGGCTDTEFLRKNNISIVYVTPPWTCTNPLLTKVRSNVYIFRDSE